MLQRQEGSSSGALNSVSKIRNCCLFTNFYPVWSGGSCLHISQIPNHYWHSLLCLLLLMHANTSQNEWSNCSNQPHCETMSIVLSYPLAACPGCCREEKLPSFKQQSLPFNQSHPAKDLDEFPASKTPTLSQLHLRVLSESLTKELNGRPKSDVDPSPRQQNSTALSLLLVCQISPSQAQKAQKLWRHCP